jgi:MerR family mercuric resistance operon transcriptional regulator
MNPVLPSGESGFTIGRLARAADVGIETIRYYQRRNLLPTPVPTGNSFRTYPLQLVNRIRFIKRAQDLGFTLDQIATLLQLEDGSDRNAIRKVATDRLSQIRHKLADLQRMENVLSHLVHQCESADGTRHCPIVAALGDGR